MTRVAVVGAGPAGATLSATLAERGIDTVLIERHTDLAREYRGEWLTIGGQRALTELGLRDLLDRLPSLRQPRARVHIRQKYRFAVGGGPDEADAAVLVSQADLLRSIIERARSTSDLVYRDGCVVRDLEVRDGRVAGVRVSTAHSDSELIEADFVVAADGRTSVVRRRLCLQPDAHSGELYDVVWFKLPRPADGSFGDAGELYLVPGGTLFFHPHPDGQLQWGWVVDKKTFGDIQRSRGGRWYEAVADLLPPERAAYVLEEAPAAHPAVLDVVCYLLPTWTAPGALLVGDAAHPMSPVGGQGINLALRDVIVTLNHLSGPLAQGAGGSELDAAAAAVQPERAPEITRIQALQRRGSDLLHQRGRVNRTLVSHVAPVLAKVGGPILERGLGTTKEFSLGVTEVHLDPFDRSSGQPWRSN